MRDILTRSKEEFYRYEPYYNRTNGKPGWQWNFLESAGKYRGRVALGSNRIGKSDQGAYEAVLAVTGRHPYRKFPAEGIGWIVSLDFNMSRDIGLPKFEKFLPKHYQYHYNKQDRIWECIGEGRHWFIYFKSTDQGRAKFQGAEIDWIWFDEEPSKTEVFSECMTRLIDRAGIWWMTATPILGTAWLKALAEREDVYSNLFEPVSMWDNPYLPEDEIKAKRADYTEDEALVRIEGQYICFGGRPVFRTYIKPLNERLGNLKKEAPPLIGYIEQQNKEYDFKRIENGPVALWEFPEKDVKYTIGVDAATGVGQSWTAFQVLSNRQPFKQVARYRAKVDTVQGSKAMVELARYYNNALLVIETRFPGNAYADAAAVLYRYPNIYRKEEYIDADPHVLDKLGISTTQADKWRFIREVTEQFKNGDLIDNLNDPVTLSELCNYIFIEDKSKTGPTEGLNDDCVDSLFLSVHGATLYPQKPRPKKKEDTSLSADATQARAMMRKFTEEVRESVAGKKPVTIM